MVDAQANIRVNLDAAQALAELKALEKQIQFFNKSIIQGSSEASRIQKEFSSSLIHNINATGKFTASMGKVHTETEKFTNALEKNKLSAREYFRYSMASTKSFGKLFGKEFGTITKVAEERVKLLQTRHIELGRAADGAMRSIKIVPNSLDYSKPITQMQLAIQKQQIFNKLLDAGTTKLLNFGKNTQWAGRQLMVGFTIPLTILGSTAIRTFRDMEMQAIRFKKVYGDIFTSTVETDAALESIKKLANEYTKYGVAITDTIKMAADAAAAGNSGAQLESVVAQATKLSVLGGVAQDQALEATIAIQNAFGATGKELDKTINFLNAVENQTVVALDDITQAIPKVAPVIQSLGGDIKDLAFFMAAMQEGGVKASEAANALKSGLASLINPSKAANEQAKQLGINLNGIVEQNAGDLRATVMTFATALQPLDELSKSRLIETIFGKYQFARLSTLFENVTKTGTQASRVLSLAASSTEELGIMAERELGVTAESAAVKFQAAIEKLKASLVPVGQAFAEALTPIIEFATKALNKFNSFSEGTKKAIVTVIAAIGGIGPVLLMSIGLIANGIANIGKFINLLRKGYQSLTVGGNELGLSTQYLSSEQLEALSVANNLHNSHEMLTDQFALEAGALMKLTTVYRQANAAASSFAQSNPQFFTANAAGKLRTPKFGKPMAEGGWVPGSGNKDTVPTTLMPGEFVVTKKAAQANSQTLEAMNKGGQAYRSSGTPSFGKMTYRSGGTPQSDSVSLVGHLQTSGLHLRQGTQKDNGSYRYSGYTMFGNHSFNQLTQNRAADIRPLMGGADVEGYPLFRKEAQDIADLIKTKPDLTINEKVALKVLQAELKQFPTNGAWQSEMGRRYALNALAAEGLDPNSPQGKALLNEMQKSFKNASSGSKNSDQLTSKLYSNADELWKQGILGDKGMRSKIKKGSPHKEYRNMPIVKLLGMLNDPNLVRAQGKFGLTVPKFLDPKYDNAGNLISVMGMPMTKQTAGVKTTSPSAGARAKSFSQKPSLKFGALAAIGTAVAGTAAQAVQNRQSGTPSYGEQGVTPAMLTPGEFVVNSQSAQKFGPQLQSMNRGGIVQRQFGTPEQEEKWVKSYADAKLWGATDEEAAKTANRLVGISEKNTRGSRVKQSLSSATRTIGNTGLRVLEKGLNKLDERLERNAKLIDKNTETLDDGTKQSNKIQKSQRLGRAASGIGMGGFAISGAAMAVGMTSKDPRTQQLANNVSMAAGTIGSLAMAAPMLANPLILAATAAIGLPAALYLMKKSVDNARIKGYEFATSMSNTSDDLKSMGEMTGNVAASEVAIKQRQSRTSPINPLRSDFGDTFITSDLGKQLLNQTSELTKDNMGLESGKIIGAKLADYVVEGLIDPAQAQSIAQAIGTSLGSQDISMSINGKLEELIGINGNDLYKDPLEVRVRLIEESKSQSEDFANTIKSGLEKVKSDSIVTDGVIDFKAFSKEWNRFISTGKVDFAQLGDFLLGTSMKDQQGMAKIAGQQVGYNESALETARKASDTYEVQMQTKRQEFIEQEKILRNAIQNTTSSEEQTKLQNKLNDLLLYRNNLENDYIAGRKEITDQQKQTLDFVMKTFTANKQIQDQMLKSSSEAVSAKYKDTPLAGLASAFTMQAEGFKNKEVTFLINTQVSSGNIGLEQAMSLISIMTGKDGKLSEEGIQKQITLYAEAKGIGVEGLDRILTATREIQDKTKRGETVNLFRDLDPTKFAQAASFLETATNLSDKDVNMNAVVDTVSIDNMASASEDIAKMNKELPDKITKEALIKFAETDSDFAGIQQNLDWFDSLPDEQTKYAIQIYRTIFETIDPQKMRAKLEGQKRGQASSSLVQGALNTAVTDEEVVRASAEEATKLTKKYFGPGSLYASVLGEEGDDAAGGGKMLPITTAQLIELRMKGLDPSTAATLDKASADKILNGTAKQQRNAIASLNATLRDSAIQTELLKNDQEVLQDTITSTTNAIGAYIDMLEATKINPIQDQIDQYNELSNAQQKQIDLYSRGLQQLSDKEDNINKIYDERISAIDKVTQANDRAAQRQQRQIDLASAIASGDFGAAAGAAAEIANAEAQAQLEDTRAALEQQQQAELAALTVEINGQLYTREQIETNIKSLEESIYQTTLLVRAEQEKIVNIEKTITAEKEKQRKLQVLTQMSQIATQMQTTVNQSARQAMGAQLGYLGQSIGLDPNSPESIAAMSQSLGINVQSLSDSILKSQQIANLTANEFAIQAEQAKKKVGDLSRFFGEASVEGKNSLGFLTNLSSAWAGDSKKSGLGGMVSTGRDILNSLSQSADAIRIGKNQIQASVNNALAAISVARRPYAFGGNVKRMAMGGNVNYKGSREPAPVRMSMGNIVPGLGNTDRVPALLTPGEFVIRKSVAKENLGLLQAMNGDVFPSMKGGIGANAVMAPIANTVMEGSTTLYNNNYSVNVNVAGTNSTADEVANVVIRKIKGINDRGIRGSRY